MSRRTIGIAAVLTAAVALTLAGRFARPEWFPGWPGKWGDSPELNELVAAVATEPTRPVDGRLTGGFKYAPAPTNNRGHTTLEPTPDVRIAVARIENLATRQRTPETDAALGVAALAVGDIDKSIEHFEDSVNRRPSAAFYSDLSAAYLARAHTQNHAEDWPKALTAAARAVALKPNLAEAAFNRALALQESHLDDQAAQAWRHYIEIEPVRPWRDEAQRRLQELLSSLPRPRPDVLQDLQNALATDDEAALSDLVRRESVTARDYLETQLIGDWARLRMSGRLSEAGSVLRTARVLERSLSNLYPDTFDRDCIAEMLHTNATTARSSDLSQTYLDYREARQSYERFDFDSADSSLQRTLAELTTARSPLRAGALLLQSIVQYYRRNFEAARRQLDVVIATTPRGYFRLLGQAHLMLGLMGINEGRFAQALADLNEAKTLFATGGDAEGATNAAVTRAEALRLVGQTHEAWEDYYSALRHLNEIRNPRRRQAIFYVGDLAAERSGLTEASVQFSSGSLEAAQLSGVSTLLAESEIRLATGLEALHDRAGALRVLQQARVENERPGRDTSSYNAARIDDLEARLFRSTDPRRSVDLSNTVIERYSRDSRFVLLPGAFLTRGRAWLAANQVSKAMDDFEEGLRAVQSQIASLSTETLRASLLDDSWSLIEEVVGVQIDKLGHSDAAFGYIDAAKTGLPSAHLSRATDSRISPTQVQTHLPRNGALLYYFALPDRLFTWVITQEHVDCLTQRISRDELRRLISLFRARLDRSAMDLTSATLLYDVLIKPTDAYTQDKSVIFIVSDDAVSEVPFAALRNRKDDTYLVDRASLVHLTAARDFVQPGPAGPPARRRALVVAATEVRDVDGEPMPLLTGAETEAHSISDLYAQPRLLLGSAATIDNFKQLVGQFDVVHFAGHTIVNRDSPALTRLLFVPARGLPSALFMTDIEALGQVSGVVVLASCDSAAGSVSRSQGVLSAASPFLRRGSIAVIGALWRLDDRQAAALFVDFHRRFAAGQPIAEALRMAQVRLLHSEGGTAAATAAAVQLTTSAPLGVLER